MNSGVSAVRPSHCPSDFTTDFTLCLSDFTTAFATVSVLLYTSYICYRRDELWCFERRTHIPLVYINIYSRGAMNSGMFARELPL
jgi:hypothetical protein